MLTELLADRCDRLLATDVATVALCQAEERLSGRPHVRFEQRSLLDGWPAGPFDLVVLSEVGYYTTTGEFVAVVERAVDSLAPDGCIVACHWRHEVADYPASGDSVHRILRGHARLDLLASHVEEDFLLDILTVAPGRSVAVAEGLV
jgi:hypothetical protein